MYINEIIVSGTVKGLPKKGAMCKHMKVDGEGRLDISMDEMGISRFFNAIGRKVQSRTAAPYESKVQLKILVRTLIRGERVQRNGGNNGGND